MISEAQKKFLKEWNAEYGVREKRRWFDWSRKSPPNLPSPRSPPPPLPPKAVSTPEYLGKTTDTKRDIVLIGTDAGAAITYPDDLWKSLCRIDVTYQSGQREWGTGFLIDPGVVLTAGHVVFSQEYGRAAEVTVTPGLTSAYAGFPVQSNVVRCRGEWPQTFSERWDFGAVILPDRIAYANFGIIPLLTVDDDYISNLISNGKRVVVAGYPDAHQGQMWACKDILFGCDATSVKHQVRTWGGDSGAPVLTKDVRKLDVAIAVHSGWQTDTSYNVACRVTNELVSQANAWIAEAQNLTS
jgi:V8-like Glu-specific endopeptidase